MLVVKRDLLLPLKQLAAFDTKGAPYIGVQLVEGQKPLFYRSNNDGVVQSKDYGLFPTTYVSLSHFTDVLKSIHEESIELSLNERGILRLHGVSVGYDTTAHVHTVAEGQAGVKHHDIGPRQVTANAQTFSGIDIKPFKLASPPVVAAGKLMLVTDRSAIIMWGGEHLAALPKNLSPREPFLRMVCTQDVDELVLTANGYWGAVFGDMVTYTKGHTLGRQLFDTYNTQGVEVTQLPAERLITGLSSAVGLLDDTDRVDVDPKLGVIAKGSFGDNRTSLGETGEWGRFGLQAKTAKAVVDALSQATDDYAILENMSSGTGPTSLMRLRRGTFEVSFRSF
jgi:hypothetical protein